MSIGLCIMGRERFNSGKSVPMAALATYIREVMDEQGMTQLELEQRSGVPDSTLSRILKGKVRDPKASVLAQIAKGLNVPFWRLMQHAGYTAEDPGAPTQEAQRLATLLEDRPELKAIMEQVADLTTEDREVVQEYILLLDQRRRRQSRKKSRSAEEQR